MKAHQCKSKKPRGKLRQTKRAAAKKTTLSSWKPRLVESALDRSAEYPPFAFDSLFADRFGITDEAMELAGYNIIAAQKGYIEWPLTDIEDDGEREKIAKMVADMESYDEYPHVYLKPDGTYTVFGDTVFFDGEQEYGEEAQREKQAAAHCGMALDHFMEAASRARKILEDHAQKNDLHYTLGEIREMARNTVIEFGDDHFEIITKE